MKFHVLSSARKWMGIIFISFFAVSACRKGNDVNYPKDDNLNQTKTYSSEVALKWLDLQYKISLEPQSLKPGLAVMATRFYAYCGVALYESVVPGMPAYQSLSGQLNGMPVMPFTEVGTAYHWPTCVNAALAYMTQKMLPLISAANIFSIDSLENALNVQFQSETDVSTFQRSFDFGKSVAEMIFNWSGTDGVMTIVNTYPPFVPPVGPGLWVPTPPNFQPMSLMGYFGGTRTMIPGILDETLLPPPMEYSTNPNSNFYISMNELYSASQSLTAEQRAQALYWRGTMGGANSAHWYAILKKVLIEQGEAAMLDKAALAYCKMGIAGFDAGISKNKSLYLYNQLRPITYIRNTLGYSTWNSLFPTNISPGYPELHAAEHSVYATAMSSLFGNNYQFSTTGTQNQNLPGYNFNSFNDAMIHATQSRFYAGVGTQEAVDAGIWIGNKTAAFMNNNIKFLKE